MKNLLTALLLFPVFAFAGVPLTMTSADMLMAQVRYDPADGGTVYIKVFDTPDHKLYCYPIPLNRIKAVPNDWTFVIDLGAYYITDAEREVCNFPPRPVAIRFWRVAANPNAVDVPPTRPMKDPATKLLNGRIAVGAPCEMGEPIALLAGGLQYRYAINAAGVRGMTVCALK